MKVRSTFDDKIPYEVCSDGQVLFLIDRDFNVLDEVYEPVSKKQQEKVLSHPCVVNFFRSGGPVEGGVQSCISDLMALQIQ